MSDGYKKSILDSLELVRSCVTQLRSRNAFFGGEWHSVEGMAVKIGELKVDVEFYPFFESEDAPKAKELLKELELRLGAVHKSYETQDRMSGIDLRQVIRGEGIRTWALRISEPGDGPPHFAVRKAVLTDRGEWTEEVEYRKRVRAMKCGLEYATWSLQLFVKDKDSANPQFIAAAWCSTKDLIQAIQNEGLEDKFDEAGKYRYIHVPLAAVPSAQVLRLA